MTRYELHANGDCYPPRCVFCAQEEPDVTIAPEDDPDLFQCVHCEQFRSVDERHVGNGHTHPGDWCDACSDGPGLWRLRKR